MKKHRLPAPISFLIATVITVGRLATLSPATYIQGVGQIGFANVLQYLFGNAGTLDPNQSLHLLLASIVLWMICFSILWLFFSLMVKEPIEEVGVLE